MIENAFFLNNTFANKLLKLTETLGFSQNVAKVANDGFSFPEKMGTRHLGPCKVVFLKSLRTKGQVLTGASVFYSEYNLGGRYFKVWVARPAPLICNDFQTKRSECRAKKVRGPKKVGDFLWTFQ